MYHAVAIGNPEALLAVLESPDKPSNLNISLLYPERDGAVEGGAVVSPLGLAAFLGNTSCLEILLNAGADIDWQDEQTGMVCVCLCVCLCVVRVCMCVSVCVHARVYVH